MVGKWTTQDIKTFGPLHSGSTGLIHTEKTADGAKRFSFYYTLRRGSESQLEPPAVAERILSEPVGAGIAFDEEMDGTFYPGATVGKDTDIAGLVTSNAKGVPCGFRLRITIEDLDAFVDSHDHRALPQGTVRFGEFAGKKDASCQVIPDPGGTFFEYLRENPSTGEREMRYSLKFRGADGKDYLLWGLKFMQRDHAGNIEEILGDYTTLFTRVFELDAAGQRGKETGVALLKFRTFENVDSVANFMKFLLSFDVVGTSNPFKKLQARNKFNVFTLQFMFREYDPLALVPGV
jgi:hypothetical protein